MKQLTGILLIAIWLVIGGGCTGMNQAFHPTPPVTYAEVIRLTQEKVMPEVIIKKIADSNTVFRLNSDEVAELRRQGVDSKVVDYMMNTYIEKVRQDQAMEDWNRWWYYDGHYYWWPYWDEYYYIPMYRHHGPRR